MGPHLHFGPPFSSFLLPLSTVSLIPYFRDYFTTYWTAPYWARSVVRLTQELCWLGMALQGWVYASPSFWCQELILHATLLSHFGQPYLGLAILTHTAIPNYNIKIVWALPTISLSTDLILFHFFLLCSLFSSLSDSLVSSNSTFHSEIHNS